MRSPQAWDDYEWQKLRKQHRRYHPICEVEGCGKRMQHVDHIVTVAEAPERRLDPTNLQSLCHPHHNRLTRAYDSGRLGGVCDEAGNPLDPNHPWNQPSSKKAIENVNDRPKADPKVAARLKRQYVNGERR
jgi:hypothetical protein